MKRSTWILAATAVVLLGFILLFERRTSGTGQWMREARRLVPVVPDEVTRLEIDRPDGRLRCERRTEGWTIVEPLECPADSAAIEEILTTLEMLDVKSLLVRAEAEDLDAYGLDAPRVLLRLDGGRHGEREIRFGADAPLGESVYVQATGREEVLIVGNRILERVDRPWDEFRERQLARFPAFDAQELEIRYADALIGLRRSDGAWTFREPAGARADRRAVQDYLGAMTSVRAMGFVADAPSDLTVFGLEPPGLDVTVRLRDGGMRRLMVGSPPPDHPEQRYVKTAEHPFVYAAASADLEPLRKTSADLRDRQVLEFLPEEIARIRIRGPQGELMLTRGDGGWTVGDAAVPGDAGVIDDFLRDLRDLAAIAFVDDAPDGLAAYGLDAPARDVLLEREATGAAPSAGGPEEGDVVPAEVTGGHALPVLQFGSGDGEEGVYVRRADEPFVVKVRESILERLDRRPVAWRDRQVLVAPAAEARRVVEQRGGRRTEVYRDESGSWRLPAETQGVLDSAGLELLIDEIVTLRAERYHADGVLTAADAGLSDPEVVLEVEFVGEEDDAVAGDAGPEATGPGEAAPTAAGAGARTVTLTVGPADPDGRGRVHYKESGLVFDVAPETRAVLVAPFFRPAPAAGEAAPAAESHGSTP